MSKSKSDQSKKQSAETGKDWVQDTRDEIAGMVKDGFDHESTKPVLKAAAVGACRRCASRCRPCGWSRGRCRPRAASRDQEVTP